ncbi:MAG: S26 family signal peptidase [Clostridium fessum]
MTLPLYLKKETGNYNIKRVIGLPGETVQIKRRLYLH